MYTTYETTELIGLMRESMIDKIAVILEREILAGEYQAGDLFSTENTLCARFGVSRTPVREALRRLQAGGLIKSSHGSGTYVCDRDVGQVAAAVNRFGLTAQTAAAAKEMMEARLILETGAIWAATARALSQPSLNAELTRCFELLERSQDDIQAFGQADWAFHHALVALSDNTFISAIHASLLPSMSDYMARTYFEVAQLPIAQAEHRAIYQGVTSGDAVRAATVLTAHLRRSMEEAMALADQLWPEIPRANKGRAVLHASQSTSPTPE